MAYKPISKGVEVESLITEKIASIESPPLEKMIRFALLYSDNVLSQKLAMLAARKSGFPLTKEGLNQTIKSKVSELGVDTTGMRFIDGSAGEYTIDEWAKACGTINYEIVTRIGPRVPRIYTYERT